MKKIRCVHRSTVLLLCIALLMMFFPQQAFASHGIQIDRNGSLTVNETYSIQNKVKNLADVELQVWRVARVTTGVKFVLTDGFAASGVSVNRLSGSEWQDAADALFAYAKANAQDVGNAAKIKTDATGKASLSNLETGLYLVAPVQTSVRVPGYTVHLQRAFLVSLPYQVSQDSAWMYDVTVTPKNEAKPYSPPPQVTTYTVHKVWNDDNDKQGKRPEQVYVRLLQNGNPYLGPDATVALQPGNWSYTWKSLPAGYKYSIEEIFVPGRYISSINGNIITNTLNPDEPEDPDNPDKPDKPGRDDDGKPPVKPDRDSDGKFPQRPDDGTPKTGDEMMFTLWMLICLGAGAGLFAASRKNHKE